jgi:hypothetical protein
VVVFKLEIVKPVKGFTVEEAVVVGSTAGINGIA